MMLFIIKNILIMNIWYYIIYICKVYFIGDMKRIRYKCIINRLVFNFFKLWSIVDWKVGIGVGLVV